MALDPARSGSGYDDYDTGYSGSVTGNARPMMQQEVRGPTPEQRAAATEEARLNNQVAVWDARTGQYSFLPMTTEELLKASREQGPGVAPPAPIQGDPGANVARPADPLAQQQTTRQQIAAYAGNPALANANQGAMQAPAQGKQFDNRTPTTRYTAQEAVAQGQPKPGGYVTVDYSRYDEAARGYDRAVQTFQSELDRLSGVDPFGNQAFLQKATDRAVAQAAGTAAMQRGGPAALAGANRQAVGVQSQLAARGAQEQEIIRARDEQTAAGLRSQNATGLANVLGQRAQNEIQLSEQATNAAATNLQATMQKYGIDAQIGQQERESLRQLATAVAQIDMQRYQTDVQYKAAVDQNLTSILASNNQLKAVMAQVEAQENISAGEFAMGLTGMVAGVAGGIATAPANSVAGKIITSDRRLKFDVRDPDLRDLQEYLGKTKGFSYKYRDPDHPLRRKGNMVGPMAQDLLKTKIGREMVGKDKDGNLTVDTQRLALADHAALAALAAEVAELKKGGKK